MYQAVTHRSLPTCNAVSWSSYQAGETASAASTASAKGHLELKHLASGKEVERGLEQGGPAGGRWFARDGSASH